MDSSKRVLLREMADVHHRVGDTGKEVVQLPLNSSILPADRDLIW